MTEMDRSPFDDDPTLAAFARSLRHAAEDVGHRPNEALSYVLEHGISTEKGELPVTAGSNVNGSATQRAALPKWSVRTMKKSLIAKLASATLVTKVGIGTAVAAAAVGGGAATVASVSDDAPAEVVEEDDGELDDQPEVAPAVDGLDDDVDTDDDVDEPEPAVGELDDDQDSDDEVDELDDDQDTDDEVGELDDDQDSDDEVDELDDDQDTDDEVGELDDDEDSDDGDDD